MCRTVIGLNESILNVYIIKIIENPMPVTQITMAAIILQMAAKVRPEPRTEK